MHSRSAPGGRFDGATKNTLSGLHKDFKVIEDAQ